MLQQSAEGNVLTACATRGQYRQYRFFIRRFFKKYNYRNKGLCCEYTSETVWKQKYFITHIYIFKFSKIICSRNIVFYSKHSCVMMQNEWHIQTYADLIHSTYQTLICSATTNTLSSSVLNPDGWNKQVSRPSKQGAFRKRLLSLLMRDSRVPGP